MRLGAAAGTAAGLVLLALVTFVLLLRRTDVVAAPPLVSRTLRAELGATGEVLLAETPAFRREWTHYFGATRGVLAATDRRVLFVGAPPQGPTPDRVLGEPPIIEQVSFPLGPGMAVSVSERFGGRARGVEVRVPGRDEFFAVAPARLARAEQLVRAVAAQQETIRLAARRAREARLRADWLAALPVYHVIRPGEALETIARSYRLSVDSLRALNGLAATRIRAGDTLLVTPGRAGISGRRIVGTSGTVVVGSPPAAAGSVDVEPSP